jgi:monoamine oxidase
MSFQLLDSKARSQTSAADGAILVSREHNPVLGQEGGNRRMATAIASIIDNSLTVNASLIAIDQDEHAVVSSDDDAGASRKRASAFAGNQSINLKNY